MSDIITVKNGKKENQLVVKVKKKLPNSSINSETSYKKVLNVNDSSDIAILMSDLALLFNAPVDKAYKKFRKEKSIFW